MEYLDIWASSIIFFFGGSFFGATNLSFNHKVPSTFSWKQLIFGSPTCIILFVWDMTSSFFYTAMVSSLNMGVKVMWCSDRSGNTWVLDSSLVRRTTGK
jgi:hypothetical protein